MQATDSPSTAAVSNDLQKNDWAILTVPLDHETSFTELVRVLIKDGQRLIVQVPLADTFEVPTIWSVTKINLPTSQDAVTVAKEHYDQIMSEANMNVAKAYFFSFISFEPEYVEEMFVDFNQKLMKKARDMTYKVARAASSEAVDQLWQPSAPTRVHKALHTYDDEAVIAALKTDPKVDDIWAREELEPKLEPKRKSAKRAKHTHAGPEGDDDPVITGTRWDAVAAVLPAFTEAACRTPDRGDVCIDKEVAEEMAAKEEAKASGTAGLSQVAAESDDDDPVITGTRTLEERNAELLQHAVDLTQEDDDDE